MLVLEGVAIDAITHILKFAKEQFGLIESDLNAAITSFRQEADQLEKYMGLPLPNFDFSAFNSKGAHVYRATFAQTRTLISRFMFILNRTSIGLCRPFFETPQFKNFRDFIILTNYLFSGSFHKTDLENFDILIQSFLRNSVQLNPGYNIKPKGHNLTHYKSTFEMWGPPKHFSTLSNERSLSEVLNAIKIPQNPCYQIAKAFKHQFDFYLADFENTFGKLQMGGSVRLPFGASLLSLPKLTCFTTMRYYGSLFAPGLCVTKQKPEKNWLSTQKKFDNFFLIKDIVEHQLTLKLIVAPLTIECFNTQFVSLQCKEIEDSLFLLSIEELFIKKTFSVKRVGPLRFIVPDGLPVKKY